MKIAYLLADTQIAGGTRVAVAHADALTARGHEVTLVATGPPMHWRRSAARWLHVPSFGEVTASGFDFVVGTFWTTLAAAYALGGEHGVHFCQGYEGSFTAYRDQKPFIDEAYALPLPKITVSPHLIAICKLFHADSSWIGQIVDDEFYQTRSTEVRRPRVLLVGPMEADFKGIDVGYDAVRRARSRGAELDLVRVSQWSPAPGEPTDLASEFHVGISTAEMVRVIASCDAFLAPSREQEGFGLPAAEAMASGVPGVLSAIPSFLSWNPAGDHALFAPEGDGAAMGDALFSLLADRSLQARLGKRGREVVEQFRADVTADRLESWFAARL